MVQDERGVPRAPEHVWLIEPMLNRMSSDQQVLEQVADQAQRREDSRSARAKQHATVTVFCLLAGAVVVLASFYLMCWLGGNTVRS